MKIDSFILTVSFGLIAACSDEVTTHFDSLDPAERQDAFKRGWLPPILPKTSRNIIETNNLDVNEGEGSFEYDLSERADYISKLTKGYSATIKESEKETTLNIISTNTEWVISLPLHSSKATYGVGPRQKQTEQDAAANP